MWWARCLKESSLLQGYPLIWCSIDSSPALCALSVVKADDRVMNIFPFYIEKQCTVLHRFGFSTLSPQWPVMVQHVEWETLWKFAQTRKYFVIHYFPENCVVSRGVAFKEKEIQWRYHHTRVKEKSWRWPDYWSPTELYTLWASKSFKNCWKQVAIVYQSLLDNAWLQVAIASIFRILATERRCSWEWWSKRWKGNRSKYTNWYSWGERLKKIKIGISSEEEDIVSSFTHKPSI